MSKILHPSPYTGLESCEVCWADEKETEIFIYKETPYCETDLHKAIQFDRDELCQTPMIELENKER